MKLDQIRFSIFMILFSIWCVSAYFLYSENMKLKSQNQVFVNDITVIANTYEAMIQHVELVNEELDLRQDLTSLIIDAARSYNIDPKLLAVIIKSESNFRPSPQHKLPQVVGSSGINTKAHKTLKHNPNSYTGNIYASAEILAKYIEDSDSLTLAIARYKGLSPLGLKFAKEIVKEYHKEK